MCGKEVDSLSKGLVEGVAMSLCSVCIKYGKLIPKVQSPSKKASVPSKLYRNKQVIKEMESQEHVVDDYSDVIRNTRQKVQMPQKALAVKLAEKESVIHSIETGRHEPSISLAKKIERLLNVKLVVEEVTSDDDELKDLISSSKSSGSSKSDSMTLGDAIVFRKRNKN